MRKSLLACAAICLLSTQLKAETRIVYISTPQLLESSPQSKAAQKKLEAEFSDQQKALLEEKDRIGKLEERMKNDLSVMSESRRKKMGREILSRKRDLRRKEESFSEDVNLRRSEIMAELTEQIMKAIARVSKTEGYDLVLSDNVAYASDQVDVTAKVLEELEKK